MADEYSFDFADVRANDNASVVAGGDQCLVDLPQRYYLLTTLTPGQLPRQVSTIDADLRSVQLVHLVVAQSRGFFVADGVDGPAVDSILHPQTLSYNADASEDSFVGGALGLHFHSMFAFVDVYAEVAKTGSRSDDVAPYFVYDEDIITLPNALFVAPYTAWNSVSILDLTVEANAAPWLRLFWLAYPLTPVVDMTDDDNDSPTMLRYMQNAAGRAFPDRYATSPRTAIAALLTVPETFNLPCELVHYDITLAARMSYVDLLVVWATGDRVLCVRDRFAWLLRHYGALQTWLEGATSKYLGASKLARAIVGDVDFDVDAIKALNVHLDAGTYDHLWSSSRTCDQNIDYLVTDLRGRGSGPSAASSSGGGFAATPANSEAVLHKLYGELTEELAADNDFAAIDRVYASGSGAAVRWLNNKRVAAKERDPLPGGFAADCAALPGKQLEYLIDALKRLDDGKLDPDLEGLDITVFATKDAPAHKPKVLVNFLSGKYASIAWEPDFIHRIAVFMNPKAPKFTLNEALADAERRGMHELYIGRLCDAVGKPPSADESFAALLAHMAPVLARGRRAGAGFHRDSVGHAVRLYNAAWSNAEMRSVACLEHGGDWAASLYDSNMSARDAFDTFAASITDTAKLARSYANALEHMITEAAGSSSGGKGGGGGKGNPGKTHEKPYQQPGGYKRQPCAPGTLLHEVVLWDANEPHGWFKHVERSYTWFHKQEIDRLAVAKLGLKGQCIEVATTNQNKDVAHGYCRCDHELQAPEHELFDRYAELSQHFVDGVHYMTDKSAGKQRQKYGGRGNDGKAKSDGGKGDGGKGGGGGKGKGGGGKGDGGKGGGAKGGRGKGF